MTISGLYVYTCCLLPNAIMSPCTNLIKLTADDIKRFLIQSAYIEFLIGKLSYRKFDFSTTSEWCNVNICILARILFQNLIPFFYSY